MNAPNLIKNTMNYFKVNCCVWIVNNLLFLLFLDKGGKHFGCTLVCLESESFIFDSIPTGLYDYDKNSILIKILLKPRNIHRLCNFKILSYPLLENLT